MGAWWFFARQALNPMAFVLLGAAAVSLGLDMQADAAFILIVVGVNVVIGGIQEYAAERSAAGLKRAVPRSANVIRDGKEERVAVELVAPGDLVVIAAGDRVPADLELLETAGLRIDEAPLTGESLPAEKDAAAASDPQAPPAERRDHAFAGTMVLAGLGRGEAVATGMGTEIGRIAGALARADRAKPPLIERMERFTWRILVAVAVTMAVVFFLALAQGRDPAAMLLLAVALGVSAVPEGLPAAIAITLAIGVRRMAERHVIVRRLMAVESLGSCTYIASDKTGTLTINELTVQRIVTAAGTGYALAGIGAEMGAITPLGPNGAIDPALPQVLRALVLANEARETDAGLRGDSVDVACLVAASKGGIARQELLNACPRLHLTPYDSQAAFSASVHVCEGAPTTLVKGSPERVLAMCSREIGAEGERHLDQEQAHAAVRALASEGFRVLAIAQGGVDEGGRPMSSDLVWLGLVGMIDPPRAEVPDAIRAAKRAGIEIAMVTGDHPITALAIARQLGLAEGEAEIVTGRQIRAALAIGEAELARLIEGRRVFARIEPTQKQAIVVALKAQGHFVAVTGDGVNDAPALRVAHVGVAMGRRGTDVARDNADLILTDDNFASIVGGIREGRIAYANIRKVVYLLVATGVAEVLLVILSLLGASALPLLPVQLLWLNLVTNGIQDVALAFDPPEGDELDRPPRPPGEAIFNRRMTWRVLSSGIYMGVAAFVIFRGLIEAGNAEAEARNLTLLAMVLFENVQALISRSEYAPPGRMRPFANRWLLWSVFATLILHLAAMHWPVTRAMLHLSPLVVGWPLAMVAAAMLGLPLLDGMVKHHLGRGARRATEGSRP